MEVWKRIPGYKGYEVSSFGRVRSYKKQVAKGKWAIVSNPQRILKSNLFGKYYMVRLMNDSCLPHTFRVHKLVALAFIGECPPGMEVCHNDGDTANNHLSNLRYDTRKGNQEDKSKHHKLYGYRRLSKSQIVAIRISITEKTTTPDKIMQEFDISYSALAKICTGKTYQAYDGPTLKRMPYCSRRKRKTNKFSSEYRGVHKVKSGKYHAQIWVGGRGGTSLSLGLFEKEIDAAKAYDKKAKELRGAFAILNFPE